MKNIFAITFFLLTTANAFAEEGYQVEVDPAIYPKEAFAQKDVKAKNIPARVKRPDAIPNKGDREAVFAAVPGLEQSIAKMDELDRDLLFVRARTKPLKDLQKTYPGLDEKLLVNLQEKLRKIP